MSATRCKRPHVYIFSLFWHLSVSPSFHLSVCMSIPLSVSPSIPLSVRLSFHPSAHFSVHTPARFSVHPSARLSVHPSVRHHPFIYLLPPIFNFFILWFLTFITFFVSAYIIVKDNWLEIMLENDCDPQSNQLSEYKRRNVSWLPVETQVVSEKCYIFHPI